MNKKTVIALLLGLTSVAAPAQRHKETATSTTAKISLANQDPKANEAILALERLEATVESGVELQDYTRALAEANFPVKMYLSGDSAATFPKLSKAIEDSMKWYRAAGLVGRRQIIADFPIGYCDKWTNPLPHGAALDDAPHMSEDLCTSYPELVTTEPDKRHYDATDNTVTENRKMIRYDDAQQKAWKLANAYLRNAEQLIK